MMRNARFWTATAVVAILVLLGVNMVAWNRAVTASNRLSEAQRIYQRHTSYRENRTRLANLRTELADLASSYETHGMLDALSSAVKSSQPDNMLIFRVGENIRDMTSFFLYTPDDSQAVVIESLVSESASDLLPGEPMVIPLTPGKLHKLDVGVAGRETVRVSLNGNEHYSKSWDGYKQFTTSSSATDLPLGITQTNTLYTMYDTVRAQVKSGRWLRLSKTRHHFTDGKQQKTVALSVFLSGGGDFFVPFSHFWQAKRLLTLQWDEESLRHRVK